MIHMHAGNLHFANVVADDDLGTGQSYLCVQTNDELRSLVQGYDQRIVPYRLTGINTSVLAGCSPSSVRPFVRAWIAARVVAGRYETAEAKSRIRLERTGTYRNYGLCVICLDACIALTN